MNIEEFFDLMADEQIGGPNRPHTSRRSGLPAGDDWSIVDRVLAAAEPVRTIEILRAIAWDVGLPLTWKRVPVRAGYYLLAEVPPERMKEAVMAVVKELQQLLSKDAGRIILTLARRALMEVRLSRTGAEQGPLGPGMRPLRRRTR